MRLRALITTVLLLGCRDASGVEYDLDDIEVTVAVPATAVRQNEQTTISVSPTNVSAFPRLLHVGCVDLYVVTTEDGTRVAPPEDRVCASVLSPPVELAPGETHTFRTLVHWTVAPGSYQLRGLVWPFPKGDADEPVRMQAAASEPITVTVSPP